MSKKQKKLNFSRVHNYNEHLKLYDLNMKKYSLAFNILCAYREKTNGKRFYKVKKAKSIKRWTNLISVNQIKRIEAMNFNAVRKNFELSMRLLFYHWYEFFDIEPINIGDLDEFDEKRAGYTMILRHHELELWYVVVGNHQSKFYDVTQRRDLKRKYDALLDMNIIKPKIKCRCGEWSSCSKRNYDEMSCRSCYNKFYNHECFQNHLKKRKVKGCEEDISNCERFFHCLLCNQDGKREDHICGLYKCKICYEHHTDTDPCYLKRLA